MVWRARQVFASASVDRTIRIWDTRDSSKAQITVAAHQVSAADAPVNHGPLAWVKPLVHIACAALHQWTCC